MTDPEAKKSSHPKYSEMITNALEFLKEKGGSSRLAILKYISTEYNVADNPKLVNSQLKIALKKGVISGSLIQVKGTGASGSFKLNKLKAADKPKKANLEVSKKEVKPKAAKIKKPAKKVFKPKTAKFLKTSTKKTDKKLSIAQTTAKPPKKSTKKLNNPRTPVKKHTKK